MTNPFPQALGLTYDHMLCESIKLIDAARQHAADRRDFYQRPTSHPDAQIRAFLAKSYAAHAERYEAERAALSVYREQRDECREKVNAAFIELFGQPMPDDFPMPPVLLP